MRDHPELTLWHAWTLAMGDDLGAVEPLLLAMEARLVELAADTRDGLPIPAYAWRANPKALLGQADTMRAMIARRRGDFAAAVTFAQRALRQMPPDVVITGVVSLQLGQVQLRCGDVAAAKSTLMAALASAERAGHPLLRVGALLGLARVRLAQGARNEARAFLRRARQSAEATGSSYLGDMVGPDLAAIGDHDDELALLEPLSPRERDVLRLLAQGLTNRAIAGHLRIAPDTVRWHAKNIYSKLGATNRTQATTQAQRFGLLETEMPKA
jgi:LuxR family maltose regulon positive regulatory protein